MPENWSTSLGRTCRSERKLPCLRHPKQTSIPNMIKSPNQIYQVKVTLVDPMDPPAWPAIWRRLLVPASITLADLHEVLQAAMGWTDSHLHEFQVGEVVFGDPEVYEWGLSSPFQDERKMRLSGVLKKPGSELTYIYDFGDDWAHKVVVEQIVAAGPAATSPKCIDGYGKCPPEDSGGIEEFLDMLKLFEYRYEHGYKPARRWLGEDFDLADFSIDEANRRLPSLFA